MLRGLLNTTLLVAIYYVLPLDGRFDADAAIRVLIGLVVFVCLVVWQGKNIIGSSSPAVKAVEALPLVLPLFCCSSLRPIS